MKPFNLEELEKQLSLAKDRVFIMKSLRMEAEIEDMTNEITQLKSENTELKNALVNNYNFTGMTLYDIEKMAILQALRVKKDNKSLAADALGITIKTLYNKLHDYGEY